MATLYVDLENGNDNYAGTSFNLLAQGTDGAVSSNVFSSSSASFPNDGSLIGQYIAIPAMSPAIYRVNSYVSSTSLGISQINGAAVGNSATPNKQYYIGGRWKNITTGATAERTQSGDTIRIMGSPAPTSLGQNGVWTSQALQASKTISFIFGSETPIRVTTTSAHSFSTGDTVFVNNASATQGNGTWEITVTNATTFTLNGTAGGGNTAGGGTVRLRNNTRVKLATAVTQNIASTGPGRANWVASTNVTTSTTTTAQKEGAGADQIAIGAAFTTGKAAYWTLPSATDLSGYQQVSFWIRSDLIGTIAAGVHELRLCSDTTGDVSVNSISIPAMSGTSRWMPFTVNLGSNLGNSIQSIALYVVTDTGAQTLLLNNIIACKASSEPDSLTLTSLIGKNTTGETWWGIQSINGTRVMLDADTNATPASTTVRGYYGTSETVTTWKRETIKLGPAAATTTALQTIQESGTDGSPITYSGGWDRTNMSTQNLETWLDGVNGNGYGISSASTSYVALEQCAFARFTRGLNVGPVGFNTFKILGCNNCTGGSSTTGVIQSTGYLSQFEINYAAANAAVGVYCASFGNTVIVNNQILSSAGGVTFPLIAQALENTVLKGTSTGLLANNANYGLQVSELSYAKNVSFQDNALGSVNLPSGSKAVLYKCSLSEASEVNVSSPPDICSLYSQNHDQTTDNHKIFLAGAFISSATDQRKTASGISWKIQPTSVSRSSSWPVVLSLAKVACAASSLVTVKAWMRRDNTGLTMRLVCKGGQIAGVTSDVVSAMTAAANTWAEQSITFTPTEVGVVEITAEAWGGTTFSGWVDDMTISQA